MTSSENSYGKVFETDNEVKVLNVFLAVATFKAHRIIGAHYSANVIKPTQEKQLMYLARRVCDP
jgi:hypothetical protein